MNKSLAQRKRSSIKFAAGLSLVAVCGLGVGAAVASQSDGASAAETASQPAFSKNSDGLTYGSLAGVTSPDAEPDLVLVQVSKDLQGYVYSSDLNAANGQTASESFKSPEDALRWQETIGREDQSIPVYEVDGTTKIGTFTIVGSDSQKKITDELKK